MPFFAELIADLATIVMAAGRENPPDARRGAPISSGALKSYGLDRQ